MLDLERRLDTADDLFESLLIGTVEELDIPVDLARDAVALYDEVGSWLADRGDASADMEGWTIYPQGSFRLGTVVQPLTKSGHYDIDLVCQRPLSKHTASQKELKTTVGSALQQFVASGAHPLLAIKEGGRCWTLHPERGFHMDVLPAIPDPDGSLTGILLTDRDLHEWQHSDPIAFADWFRVQMAQEFDLKRAAMAEVRKSTVADVPEWQVRTTLQRAVQVMKRHRDIHFGSDRDGRPPSILITTLAARAYTGEQNLFAAVVATVERMPRYVERDGQGWVVSNPVQPAENFADKWREHPERAEKFFGWLTALARDLTDARKQIGGIDKIAARLSEKFGEAPVAKSVQRMARDFKESRESGKLSMTAGTGALVTTGAATRVRPHTFYGEEAADT